VEEKAKTLARVEAGLIIIDDRMEREGRCRKHDQAGFPRQAQKTDRFSRGIVAPNRRFKQV